MSKRNRSAVKDAETLARLEDAELRAALAEAELRHEREVEADRRAAECQLEQLRQDLARDRLETQAQQLEMQAAAKVENASPQAAAEQPRDDLGRWSAPAEAVSPSVADVERMSMTDWSRVRGHFIGTTDRGLFT